MQVGETTKDGKTISKIERIVGIRKMTIESLQESIRRSPQVSGFVHADVSGVVKLRQQLKDTGEKVSITDIFVKLAALAIEKHPEVNCSRVNDEIHYYSSINIGVAVGTPNGMLIVPVIKNCEEKSLFDISAEMKDIQNKAKNNQLTMDMMQGGTFTLSSIGMFNVDNADPILNVPQSGIIAIGRIQNEPVVLDDMTFGICPKAYLSITLDHGTINGAPASMFMRTFSEYAADADKLIKIN
jgi:pyruvate dehydrogenase E2 component (dihydrolipoamide acetyltransferase)